MRRLELSGEVFGRLTVISFYGIAQNKGRSSQWICECSCGKYVVVYGNNLKQGTSTSCGCWQKEKLAKRSKGRTPTPETIAKNVKAREGYCHSEGTKDKIRKAVTGENNGMYGVYGENHPSYIDGRTPENARIRSSPEYLSWRDQVFKRDEYTCQDCKALGVFLNAHHIKRFTDYPELRFDVSNGKTLCIECHNKYRKRIEERE